MKKTLIIKPIGGMGNRLYAMASARELALQQNRDLKVLWTLRWELNARFSDFWEPDGFDFTVVDEYNLPWRWLNKARIQERWLNLGATVISDPDMYSIRDQIGGYDYAEFFGRYTQTPKLSIETCFNFYPRRKTPLKDIFIPARLIREGIDSWHAENGKDYIGLHIRRTDHGDAIGASPDSLFEKVIEETDPAMKVFLCTDDQPTEDRFRIKYGNRILTYSRNKTRDSREGIRNAVMDMLLLSGSTHVYGSFKSTFSSFAADYGGIPLTVLTL